MFDTITRIVGGIIFGIKIGFANIMWKWFRITV